jgi:HAD superfamily hydrolase (TIGR01509 family)
MADQRAILWDMDGVLVDTGKLHYESWIEVLKPYNLTYSWDIFASTFGTTNPSIIKTLFDNPSEDFITELGEAKERAFRASVPGRISLLPGAGEWLQKFSDWGYGQAICSSAPVENIDVLIDGMGIRHHFNALVSALHLASKPDPAVFLKAADALGAAPHNCIVIEDAPAGVEGARRGGMKCIAVATTQPESNLQAADLIVNRLNLLTEEQVLELFER